MTTVSVTNTSGISGGSTTFLYVYNSNPNLLSSVQVNWYAQGSGILNALVTGVTDSSISVVITIGTSLFQSGSTYYFTQSPLSSNPPCFKEGTEILCLKDNKEVYVPIQDIRKGDLVITIESGPLIVTVVATSLFINPPGSSREKNKLYKCSKDQYSELTDDLFITGKHSVLVNTLTLDEQKQIKGSFGRLPKTGNKYRLMAFIDERAQPCTEAGVFPIYHLALENDKICYNYGIYVNGGLLVETCNTDELLRNKGMREIL